MGIAGSVAEKNKRTVRNHPVCKQNYGLCGMSPLIRYIMLICRAETLFFVACVQVMPDALNAPGFLAEHADGRRKDTAYEQNKI